MLPMVCLSVSFCFVFFYSLISTEAEATRVAVRTCRINFEAEYAETFSKQTTNQHSRSARLLARQRNRRIGCAGRADAVIQS